MLTDKQRDELHLAVLQYLGGRNVSKSVLDELASQLGLSEPAPAAPKGLGLESKWLAVVRLQRKILDLEAQLQALQQQSREPQLPTQSTENWLPRLPPFAELLGHRKPVTSVCFHPVWSIVVSGCEDGSFKVWDTETGEIERTVRAHTRAITDVDFGKTSGLLASSSSDLTVKVWDSKSEYANIRTLVGHEHTVSAVKWIPHDDKLLASASRDKTVRIWQVDTGYTLRVIKGHSDWVRTLALSGDGKYIISAGSDHTARLSSVEQGDTKMVFMGHEHVVECCAVAPAEAEAVLAKLEGLDEPVKTAYSPSLSYFATAGRDRTIILWNVRKEPIAHLHGHDNWVRGLVFHPNGRYLLSVADDKTLRVWDLTDGGRCIKVVPAHDHFVTSIAWGGKRTVATGCVDHTIRLWK